MDIRFLSRVGENRRRFFCLILLCFISVLEIEAVFADAAGKAGRSGAPPRSRDCTGCHAAGPAVPTVAFSGPAAVAVGSTSSYLFSVTGGAAVAAAAAGVVGLDVAAPSGTLVVKDAARTKLLTAEITHSAPIPYVTGGIKVAFDWTAPATAGIYTLYGAGLSGNGDKVETGDGTATTSFVVTVGTPPAGGGTPGTPVPGAGGGTPTVPPAVGVPPVPGALTAVISGPATGAEAVSLTFDGANSTVSGATITDYSWDFGDGASAVGVRVSHTFVAGVYAVVLAVTDTTGATNSAQLDVTIGAVGSSSGQILYDTNCAECHGPGGTGTLVAPISIVNASSEKIAEAIEKVTVMKLLADVLSEDDISDIARFLKSSVSSDGATVKADSIGGNRFARSVGSSKTVGSFTKNAATPKAKANGSAVSGSLYLELFALALLPLVRLNRRRRNVR